MADATALGDRMKAYEAAADMALPLRLPVIVRVDGKAFHTYTAKLARPWDESLAAALDQVALALCENIQGARLAYAQSDEISVLVHNYARLATMPWLSNRVQKMASVAASIAGAVMTAESGKVFGETRLAFFDARAFVLPEAEVANYFLWRQRDAERNSIQMLAQSLYSHRELHKKNNVELQELCWQKGHNWNDLPAYWRRGRCAARVLDPINLRHRWVLDREPPIWRGDGRNYIDRLLATELEDDFG